MIDSGLVLLTGIISMSRNALSRLVTVERDQCWQSVTKGNGFGRVAHQEPHFSGWVQVGGDVKEFAETSRWVRRKEK